MPAVVRTLCIASLAASSVLAVAACGSSGNSAKPSSVVQADNGEAAKTGPQVMKDAVAAMVSAGAVRVTANITQGQPPQKLTEDGHVQSDGMSISMTSSQGEQAVRYVGKTVYMKNFGALSSAAILPAGLAKTVANRWVKFDAGTSSDSSGSTTFSSTDDDGSPPTLAGMAKEFAAPEDGVTINAKVTRGSLSGQPVVIVTESNGSSFKVAASGAPYVLQATLAHNTKSASSDDDGDDASGTLTFSEYGKRIAITAPADAIDLEKLLKSNPDALIPTSLPTDFPSDFPTDIPSS